MADDTPHRPKRPRDVNQLAKAVVDVATGDASDEEAATVVRARRAGTAGGPARASSLSPERRREIASQAAAARWGKPSKGQR